jgi:cytochrome P450
MMAMPFRLFPALILVLVSWPLIRFVSIPSIWREYSRLAVIAVAILTIWYSCIAIAVLALPWLLVPAATIAACLLAIERWRARITYGTSRGLPPGSLTLVPRGPWVDERFYAAQAETHGPVFKMSQFFRPMVCVMGPAEGVDLLETHSVSLYSPTVRFSRFIPQGYIRYMAPQNHSFYKSLFRTALNSKVLGDCAEDFRELIVDHLAQMARTSQETRAGIHPETCMGRLTFPCMVRLFIGIDADSPAIERLSELYRMVEIGKAASKWRSEDRKAANAIADFIEERMETLGSSLPSCFLGEIRCTESELSTDRTVLLNIVYMIRVSSSDLAGFLTWAVKLLAENPAWFHRLQALITSGSDAEAEDLAALMLRETLRMERSEFIFRKARTAIQYKGFNIPRDWIVRVCIRDGHRDASTFANPDTFDPMRFRNRAYSRKEYSPLGIGPHACLGGQTINVVGKIFLVELARSWSITVVADGDREYGRSHWQPSSSFRIVLAPVTGTKPGHHEQSSDVLKM